MNAPNPFRCYVIGSESLLVQCSELLLDAKHEVLGVITARDEIARWASERGIPVIAPGRGLAERLGPEPFDWLFSIANVDVIADDVLRLPRRGAINFHDGPLPRYAGLHATTWAIFHGERTHGVTWHRIEGGIDEGDIIEQRVFELAERETALTLNTRCYELGIETFARMIDALGRGEEPRRAQDLRERSYFGRYDRPRAACAIDWNQPAYRIDALVRALDYGRYANPVGVPKVVLPHGVLLLPEVERAADSVAEPPGTVLAIDDGGLEVATATGSLLFPKVLDPDGRPVAPELARRLGVERGTQLSLTSEARDRLTEIDADLAKSERFWARRLAQLEPAQLASVDRTESAAPRYERRAIEASAEVAVLAAGLGTWLARVSGKASCDVGYRHLALAARVRGAEALYASHVPLRLAIEESPSFAELVRATREELARVEERGTYLADLVYRAPSARKPDWDIVIERVDAIDGAAPPPSTAAAIVTDGTRTALVFDASRLPSHAAESLRHQLEVLLRAGQERPETLARELPLLSPEEQRRVLVDWNATELGYARDRCVHQLFEAQVDRAPNAIAITHRDVSLTYAELDRRANQLAHHLVALGVGPDTPVGLSTDRSPDMMIGALAIMKAGGAYVPLDPSYPAERIAFMVEDSRAPVIVTQARQRAKIPDEGREIVLLDEHADSIATRPEERPAREVASRNMAYLIYTSGSTGTPKGVMVEHRNVANFFTGMDQTIAHDAPGVWLAVTSLSFDISVLELFYTLARGFEVVLASDDDRAVTSGASAERRTRALDFALFYFASDEGERAADKYRLLLEGARFGDEHGFSAVWTPERHFHAFGGLYPNPSVASAALAVITKRVKIRAGSCVNPLHHPIRVAEEWALVDNLSNGRVGISFAAGWQPNDFVLRPEAFADNKQRMIDEIDVIRRLWRGETLELAGPKGPVKVRTLPRPVQPELPFWITAAGNPETFALAGKLGGGILTHLLGQSVDEVRTKIEVYRAAWREAGHPGEGRVTLMLHTFVGPDAAKVKEIVREPMKSYLRSSLMLIQQHAWSFPAFKRHAREDRSFVDNFQNLSPEDTDALLEHSFERYYETSGLFGTPESCTEMVERCRAIGVDEIGCLIDFGIDSETVLAHLPHLDRVRAAAAAPANELAHDDYSIAAQIVRRGVTHMQCTPSMARMLMLDPAARAALGRLSHLLIGGEAFPVSLARELRRATRARITNMYGPTETTIWSSTEELPREVADGSGAVSIGRPIANTSLYVLDEGRQPVPIGVTGELYIGGEGVTRGYWERTELTEARFVPDPFAGREGARMYRTGDAVRFQPDGRIEFLGRMDHQVKIRGYRIELGEIEARLATHDAVREAVVIAREDSAFDQRLVAYVIPRNGRVDPAALKAHLRATLPDFMVPAHFVRMDRFPLTPNKKIDKNSLPKPEMRHERDPESAVAPSGDIEQAIASIWKRILGLDAVSSHDNFFDLGGHSLLAVQAHREIKEVLGKELTVTDIFRFPTIAGLAAHVAGGGAPFDAGLRESADRAAARRHAASASRRRVLRRT